MLCRLRVVPGGDVLLYPEDLVREESLAPFMQDEAHLRTGNWALKLPTNIFTRNPTETTPPRYTVVAAATLRK